MKFAILHHAACAGTRFHFRIDSAGRCHVALAESEPGEHPKCIDIVVEGDANAAAPRPVALEALRKLLLQLKTRYPDIQLGGHRQIRGADTTCPGKRFPLSALHAWASHELIAERDAMLQEMVDRQYRP